MKNEYRKMMEQVNLSDHVKNDILEQLKQKNTAKRKVRPLRVAVIAACVCLALVGGAFAAVHLSGVWMGEQTIGEDHSAYRVQADFTRWEVDDLGERIRSDLAKGTLQRSFQSRAELEEYLGVDLIRHDVLENASIVSNLAEDFEHGWDLRPELKVDPTARYVLSGMTMDNVEMGENPQVLKVTTHRVVDNFEVYTDARIITECADVSLLEQGLLGEFFDAVPLIDWAVSVDEGGNPVFETIHYTSAEKVITSEPYVMSNGLEATIVTVETVDRWVERQEESGLPVEGHGFREYAGFFVHDGVLYTVRPWAVYDPTVAMNYENGHSLQVLKTVLDGFVF